MQQHLKFHTLTSFEIDSFVKNEKVMADKLKKAVKVVLRNVNNEKVGVVAQVYADSKQVVGGAELTSTCNKLSASCPPPPRKGGCRTSNSSL